jgi:large subunit ribosomal protein L9
MKVILLSDVAKVGKKYDLVEVAPGFARNFLFAKGFAEAITKSSAKRVADLQKKREVEKARQEELLANAFGKAKGASVTLKRSANEEGSLYAGVSAADLATALGKSIGAAVEESHILIEKPIKMLGEFTVVAEIGGKKAEFTVVVEAE